MKQLYCLVPFLLICNLSFCQIIYDCDLSKLKNRPMYVNMLTEKDKRIAITISMNMTYAQLQSLDKESTEVGLTLRNAFGSNKKADIKKYIQSVIDTKNGILHIKQLKETMQLDFDFYCFCEFLRRRYLLIQKTINENTVSASIEKVHKILDNTSNQHKGKIASIITELQRLEKLYPPIK